MIGECIKTARTKKKMSQYELAELIDKDHSAISKYESGKLDVPGSVLKAIADSLGITLAKLLKDA